MLDENEKKRIAEKQRLLSIKAIYAFVDYMDGLVSSSQLNAFKKIVSVVSDAKLENYDFAVDDNTIVKFQLGK